MSLPTLLSTERLKSGTAQQVRPGRLNLYRVPWLRPILQSPWPQFLVRAVTLAGFIFTIAAGIFGVRAGGSNFAIIFVWIAWWTALKLGFIPLGGRSWCSICPIPLPGEWLQRGGILQPGKGLGLNRRWPKWLRGTWLQSGAFLVIGIFSVITLTNPRVAAWVLAGLFALAIGLSLVYEQRAFCSYLCPIGGFTGLYAKTAPVEVRVLDKAICLTHQPKTCYQACPWGIYPVSLWDSATCGLCLACLRACPSDNLALNLRPPGDDLINAPAPRRLDEAFFASVMLGSALAFAAVFTGPWGALKNAAYAIGSVEWGIYALGFLALNLAVLPGFFALSVWVSELGKKKNVLHSAIANQTQALLPLGLTAWIAFTLSFALPKAHYVLAVISDPLGWGWDLFGTAGAASFPGLTGPGQTLQVVILLGGLFWSAEVTRKRTPSGGCALPVQAFSLIFALVMLWLLI
ncbi:MAG: 4Fe-4S binding protein [Chloroflexota bacterium]